MTDRQFKIDNFSTRYHIYYWIGSLLMWTLFVLITDGEWKEPFFNKLCYLPSQMIVTYSFLYFLIPNLYRKHWIKLLGGFIATAYIATVLARITKIYIYETVMGHNLPKNPISEILTEIPYLLIQYMIWVFLTPLLTILILLLINHLKGKEKIEQLKKEKNIAELKFLKAQVHPHFLFNTLNNIYTLAIQNSPKTAETTNKLSDILKYMFHKCSAPTVTLKDEIALLQNYIDLEKMRYGNRLQVTFNHLVVDENKRVAPLLFLSLLENAFKHGASSDIGNPIIRVDLLQSVDTLKCKVYNTKPRQMSSDERGYRKGIGLQNVKRQLELLYPGNYTLEVQDLPNSYTIVVSISLPQNRVV